jgi:hypothetical protein
MSSLAMRLPALMRIPLARKLQVLLMRHFNQVPWIYTTPILASVM